MLVRKYACKNRKKPEILSFHKSSDYMKTCSSPISKKSGFEGSGVLEVMLLHARIAGVGRDIPLLAWLPHTTQSQSQPGLSLGAISTGRAPALLNKHGWGSLIACSCHTPCRFLATEHVATGLGEMLDPTCPLALPIFTIDTSLLSGRDILAAAAPLEVPWPARGDGIPPSHHSTPWSPIIQLPLALNVVKKLLILEFVDTSQLHADIWPEDVHILVQRNVVSYTPIYELPAKDSNSSYLPRGPRGPLT